MKGFTSTYPYEPLEGLNPIQQEISVCASYIESTAKRMSLLAQIGAYFAPFSEITSDDIKSVSMTLDSVSMTLDSLSFALAEKDSKFVHHLAQFTGLSFKKGRGYDGQSLNLTATVPETHALYKLGVHSLIVFGYLPDSCKVVVKEYLPLSEATAEVYRKLLEQGAPVYETVCGGDAPGTEPEAEPETMEVL